MTKLTKEYLAKTMPQTTEVVARFREAFGSSLKVLWAIENGVEVGKLPDVKSVTPNYYVESDLGVKKRP